MSEQLDTFDSVETVTVKVQTKPEDPSELTQHQEAGIDSFENGEYVDTPEKAEKVLKSSKKDSKDIQKEELGEQNEDTDAKKAADEKKSKEQAEKDKDSDEPESKEAKGEEKKPEQEKPKGKGYRVKIGDDRFDVPQDAMIRVPVDGKMVETPLSEVISKYNASLRFEDIDRQQSEFKKTQQSFEAEKQTLATHLQNVENLITGAMEGKNNPLDAVSYLLDLSGGNSLEFRKVALSSLMDEVEKLQDMDDTERDLYWKTKELEYLKTRSETSTKRMGEITQQQEREAQIRKLRETHGVSEEQFASAFEDLKQLGTKNPTPEQALEYARWLPKLEKAESIVKPYASEIGAPKDFDAVVQTIAETLMEDPSFTDEEIIELLEEKYGAVKVLNAKALAGRQESKDTKPKGKVAVKEEGPESFDDFDSLIYS